MRAIALGLALLVVVASAACAPAVQRGGDLYKAGRYVDADALLEQEERRFEGSRAALGGATRDAALKGPSADHVVAHEPPGVVARYHAFRGLTLLALGDAQRAQQYLSVALEQERQHPGTLDDDLAEKVRAALTDASDPRRVADAVAARPATRQ